MLISFIIQLSEIISLLMFLVMFLNMVLIVHILYKKIRYGNYFTTCDLNIFYLASKDGTKFPKIVLDILTLFSFLNIFAYTPLVSISNKNSLELFLFLLFIVYVAWSYWCISVFSSPRKVFPLFLNPFARYRFIKNYHSLMKSVYRAVAGESFCEDVLDAVSLKLKNGHFFISSNKITPKEQYISEIFYMILVEMVKADTISPEKAEHLFSKFQEKEGTQ